MSADTLPVPRKTPVQARSSATVEAILEAAAHILEAEGLEGYTTNAIAKRAGVSIGSLYQYFPNKDAVTAALVRSDSDSMAVRMEEVMATHAGRPVRDCIDALIDVAVCHQFDRPLLARLIDLEEHRLGGSLGMEDAKLRIVGVVRNLLANSDLELPFDVETVTQDIFAMSHGITDSAGMSGETDRARLNARIRHAILSYLGLPPS
ncbi:MAG: TetR/AcrR family transcriptional regulator [Hyphomonas sp.]|uniref:TetR/AcrR family transcriptional regulator n=1 Tax=Hyphomonas sp. TaxID=87 RepID=UPI003527F018